MRYRADIDGLRAVAVAAVLLYHFQVGALAGGFLGVDVFFVISGFLITGIILPAVQNNTFTFSGFYKKRVLRIFPLFAVVLACCFAAGMLILSLKEFRQFSQDAAYAALGVSNIHFFLHTGYFDLAAKAKPLLHTWSLGVEEQFYFCLPVLLVMLRARSVRFRTAVLGGLAACSLTAMLVTGRTAPDAAFYLLPFRAWELLAGALLAMHTGAVHAGRGSLALRQAVSLGGAALIGSGMVYATPAMHPGWVTLLPVAGTCAVIWGAHDSRTLVNRLLSLSAMRFTGRISYSLYLWHWPVLVFGVMLGGPLTPQRTAVMLMFCVVLSWLSWRYVEQPARHSERLLSGWRPVQVFVPVLLLLVAAGITGFATKGLPQRLTAQGRQMETLRAFKNTDVQPEKLTVAAMTPLGGGSGHPDFIVWGDSHAEHLYPLFVRLAQRYGLHGLMATHSNTIPSLNVQLGEQYDAAVQFNRKMLEAVRATGVRHVILAARWQGYLAARMLQDGSPVPPDRTAGAVFASVGRLTADLRAMGCTVWLVEDVPGHAFSALDELQRPLRPSNAGEFESTAAAAADKGRAVVERFLDGQAAAGVQVVRTRALFLSGDRYLAVRGGVPLYRDTNHLSAPGALLLEGALWPVLAQIGTDRAVAHRTAPVLAPQNSRP